MVDLQKLIKVLAMTTSLHDGEALNAIRAANELLATAGKRWEDVVVEQPLKPVYGIVAPHPKDVSQMSMEAYARFREEKIRREQEIARQQQMQNQFNYQQAAQQYNANPYVSPLSGYDGVSWSPFSGLF